MSELVLKCWLTQEGDAGRLLRRSEDWIKPHHAQVLLDHWAATYRPENFYEGGGLYEALFDAGFLPATRAVIVQELGRRRRGKDDFFGLRTAAIFASQSLETLLDHILIKTPPSAADSLEFVYQIALGELSDPGEDETLRTICILYLLHRGDRARLLPTLLGTVSEDSQARSTLISLIEIFFDDLRSHLWEIFEDSSIGSTVRSYAGAFLLRHGDAPLERLSSIMKEKPLTNFPMDIPGIPADIRRGVLRRFARSMEEATDPRLLLESFLIQEPAGKNPYYQDRKETPWFVVGGDQVVFGPLSATEWNGDVGGGCYDVYVMFCEAAEFEDQDEEPKDAHLAFFVSTLAPYWRVEYFSAISPHETFLRDLKEESLARSTLGGPDNALYHFQHWAESKGIQELGSDIDDTIFPGLYVYYFGRHHLKSVRDLLYYWQD